MFEASCFFLTNISIPNVREIKRNGTKCTKYHQTFGDIFYFRAYLINCFRSDQYCMSKINFWFLDINLNVRNYCG